MQRAIEAQERIIQTTTELKKALMHKLFTEGLRNEPQKQTEIGPVPESWELLPIGDLFETQLGKMLSQKAKVGDSPKLYLRNKNVQWGRIETEDLLRMDFNDREAVKFQLRKGDLMVCEGGEVGRAALWDGSIVDCYYQKALHRLRPKTDQITNEFMVHWMMFAFLLTNTYGVTGTRTTIAHLPEIKLKPLLVPVPPPNEQAEIIAVLDTADQKHAGHQRKLGALKDLFRTLLHELMTAKIRDLLDAKVREFNPRYAEAEGALPGQLRHLHTDIYGNREFVEHLRSRGKFFDHEEKRERDLILIAYDDLAKNVFEVTEEWAFHNGHYGTREDVVFLINGIPVLVIECKNANKDEAIALGVDQIRRYHREMPELFVSQQLFTATDAIGFSYGVTWNMVRRNGSFARPRRTSPPSC